MGDGQKSKAVKTARFTLACRSCMLQAEGRASPLVQLLLETGGF